MAVRKGIILVAGKATRLQPMTQVFGKPLLPIFDKPMIYYPISTLITAGIRDILIVTAPRDTALFQQMLGDGSQFGIQLSFAEQPVAKGIADAFLIGEDFIKAEPCCLLLGDNFFYSDGLPALFQDIQAQDTEGATIFCKHVEDPSAYGVADFDAQGKVTRLVEKPRAFISHHAVTGLYFYDHTACTAAKNLTPSSRGELEITDLNIQYLQQSKLLAKALPEDTYWQDLGTPDTMLAAAQFVQKTQNETGLKIGCPYTAAFMSGLIDAEKLSAVAAQLENADYAAYLQNLPAHSKS